MKYHKSFLLTSHFSLLTFFFLAPILLCIPFVVYAQPDSTQEVYEYVMQWGSYGSDTAQFNGPSGMCIDDTGYLYVCDRWNNRIQKFDTNGRFILMWGREGSGQGEFNEPYDITADHSGYIYVNDGANYRIQKFDSRGNFILMWTDTAAGIDVSPSNFVYTAGGGNGPYDSVRIYDTLGNKQRAFGSPFGTQYWLPQALCCDDSGFVYVGRTVTSNFYMLKFDSSDNYLLRWGSSGLGDGQFDAVYTMRSGEGSKVFVPDAPFVYPNYRVQKFSSDSTFITKWGSRGTGNGQFMTPFSVVVDSAGFAYVSDFDFGTPHRIQKFRKTVVGVEAPGGKPIQRKALNLWVLSPVRTVVTARYSLPKEEAVRIGLYDLSGRKVRSLVEEVQSAGGHELRMSLALPAGVYFLVLESPSGRKVAKVVQIR